MKNFFEKLKDILYASIDYVIMIAIIGIVILIIGWRLDILFQKDVLATVPKNDIVVEKPKEEEKDKPQENLEEEKEDEIKVESPEKGKAETDKNDLPKEDAPTISEPVKNIEIKIPEGSFPAQIGSILESKGLVNSSTDFIKKAVDLNLDTKLKSGSFSIPENSSVEAIVKIISKQRT